MLEKKLIKSDEGIQSEIISSNHWDHIKPPHQVAFLGITSN